MYFRIRDSILYRQYGGYGYITDNSEYEYQTLGSALLMPGEEYVTESGAFMLAALRKTPRHIDEIVADLSTTFDGVDCDTLKQDAIDFFMQLTARGFLSMGETFDACLKCEPEALHIESVPTMPKMDDCDEDTFSANDFLRSLHIEVASACNERCLHCYIPHEDKTKTINPELFRDILKQGRDMNIVHVTLSGGEPLLHNDIQSFLALCRQMDLSVNVLTNLTLLTNDIVNEMKKNPLLSVQTSIYSMDPIVHDGITRQAGSLDKTMRAVLELRAADIPIQISCPIMKQNNESFSDVIEWASSHDISVAVEPQIFGSYDHSRRNLANRLSLEELGIAMDRLLAHGYAQSMHDAAIEKESRCGTDPVCSICRSNLCISVTGEVYPCVGWQTQVLGSLRNQSLRDIWEGSEQIARLRKVKLEQFPRCVDCCDRGYCTVCMMCNSNENPEGDPFLIDGFHCEAAALIHRKVDAHLREHAKQDDPE